MVNDNEITYNQSDFLAPILKRKCKYGEKGLFLSQNFLPKTYCATLKPIGSGHFSSCCTVVLVLDVDYWELSGWSSCILRHPSILS
jgi:hypothetical protein